MDGSATGGEADDGHDDERPYAGWFHILPWGGVSGSSARRSFERHVRNDLGALGERFELLDALSFLVQDGFQPLARDLGVGSGLGGDLRGLGRALLALLLETFGCLGAYPGLIG